MFYVEILCNYEYITKDILPIKRHLMQRQTLSLSLQTPDSSYGLEFLQVHESINKLVAVLKLDCADNNMMMSQVLTTSSASIEINRSGMYAKPVEYFVIGVNPNAWYLKSNQFKAISSFDSPDLINALHGTHPIRMLEQTSHNSLYPSH